MQYSTLVVEWKHCYTHTVQYRVVVHFGQWQHLWRRRNPALWVSTVQYITVFPIYIQPSVWFGISFSWVDLVNTCPVPLWPPKSKQWPVKVKLRFFLLIQINSENDYCTRMVSTTDLIVQKLIGTFRFTLSLLVILDIGHFFSLNPAPCMFLYI
jgi:hypothetical protein